MYILVMSEKNVEFSIDYSQITAYSLMMSSAYPKQMRNAVKDTLTKVAYRSSQQAKNRVLPKEFVLRNKYTQRGIRYDKAKGSTIDNAYSKFGSLQKFKSNLALQDQGGTLKPKGNNLSKGTKASRMGQSYYKKTRSVYNKSQFKPVTAANFATKNTRAKIAPKTRRGRLIGAIMWAKRTGFKGLLATKAFSGAYGAYKVAKNKLSMIYNLDHKEQKIKPTQWQEKSRTAPLKSQQKIFNLNMSKQIDYLAKKYKFK
jgi:hypothetical protein